MEIPSSINPEIIEKSTLTVGVNNLGEIIFDAKVISRNELREELKKIEEADKYNIVIAGEKNTTLENLIEIMDEFRRVGISSVAIATQKKN
jgi:biopolymer transport protein ExbD